MVICFTFGFSFLLACLPFMVSWWFCGGGAGAGACSFLILWRGV